MSVEPEERTCACISARSVGDGILRRKIPTMENISKGAAIASVWGAVAVIAYCAPAHLGDSLYAAIWATVAIGIFF